VNLELLNLPALG